MTKEDLRKLEIYYKERLAAVPDKHKPFWRRQLKDVKEKLYGK